MSMTGFMNRLRVVQDDPRLKKRKELAEAIQEIRELLQVSHKVFLTDPKGEVRVTIWKDISYFDHYREPHGLNSKVDGLPWRGDSPPDGTLSWAIGEVLNEGIGKISPLLLPSDLSYRRVQPLSEKEINALYDFISQATVETEAEKAD